MYLVNLKVRVLNTILYFVAFVMSCALKQVHCTVWGKGYFRAVEGGGRALCPTEALNSLVARLDVSCCVSENILSNSSY